jgi:hypothetical protein
MAVTSIALDLGDRDPWSRPHISSQDDSRFRKS